MRKHDIFGCFCQASSSQVVLLMDKQVTSIFIIELHNYSFFYLDFFCSVHDLPNISETNNKRQKEKKKKCEVILHNKLFERQMQGNAGQIFPPNSEKLSNPEIKERIRG